MEYFVGANLHKNDPVSINPNTLTLSKSLAVLQGLNYTIDTFQEP